MLRFHALKPICMFTLMCFSVILTCAQSVMSPNGKCQFSFSLQRGKPIGVWNVEGNTVLSSIPLGLELVGDSPSLMQDFLIKESLMMAPSSLKPYHEMSVLLMQRTTAREMQLHFRVFNDSVLLCYEFPAQNTLSQFRVRFDKQILEMQSPVSTPWLLIAKCEEAPSPHSSFWQRIKKWLTRKK